MPTSKTHDRKNHALKSKGEKAAEVFPIMQKESMYLCDAQCLPGT